MGPTSVSQVTLQSWQASVDLPIQVAASCSSLACTKPQRFIARSLGLGEMLLFQGPIVPGGPRSMGLPSVKTNDKNCAEIHEY